MTVKELIENLERLPQDSLVIMSKDAGGNQHGPLSVTSVGVYAPETTWRGAYYDPKEFEEEGYEYDAENIYHVVCLWPVS
jgi:hypothetical protein